MREIYIYYIRLSRSIYSTPFFNAYIDHQGDTTGPFRCREASPSRFRRRTWGEAAKIQGFSVGNPYKVVPHQL